MGDKYTPERTNNHKTENTPKTHKQKRPNTPDFKKNKPDRNNTQLQDTQDAYTTQHMG